MGRGEREKESREWEEGSGKMRVGRGEWEERSGKRE